MKLRPFELALVIIFAGLALAALFILKFYQPSNDEETPVAVVGAVEIWGTFPASAVNAVLTELAKQDKTYLNITYKYYTPTEFDQTLVTALADRVGPDLVLLSHEHLAQMRRRIQPFSSNAFPLRDYRDRYLDGAEIFYLSDGLYGYPLAVDPLMLYWNRDLLATDGYLAAPKTWEELVSGMFPDLIRRGFDRTIDHSVVAMGEYNNVRNAFGIVSMLLLQQGSQGVVENGTYSIRLQNGVAEGVSNPLAATADFYTRFSRPSNALYSWNRAFTEDRQQFIGEKLAFYFGYGSEGRELERLNPNLNFDIAEVPQGDAATIRRTFGRFYALSLLHSSDNLSGAQAVMLSLAAPAIAEQIATRGGMVPATRAAVAAGSSDKFGRVTYRSASIALGWLNPDPVVTDQHFSTMMQDINENRRDTAAAASDLVKRLSNEY